MNRHPYDTPESDFPHKTHDLSALSRYFHDASAFTTIGTMGRAAPLGLHDSKTDIAKAYTSISELPDLSLSDLLLRKAKNLDYSSIDFDRFGIVCEFPDCYFTILQVPPSEANGKVHHTRFVWCLKRAIGIHLVTEWESLPKQLIGGGCVVATGSTDGWWHSHSAVLMRLRQNIAGPIRSILALKLSKGEIIKTINHAAEFTVQEVYRTMKKSEEEEVKAAESAMNEFTVLGEQ